MPQKPPETPVQSCPDDDERTRQELLDELGYLRAENAYLKKLDALIREQNAARAKKRK
jgi:transposase